MRFLAKFNSLREIKFTRPEIFLILFTERSNILNFYSFDNPLPV